MQENEENNKLIEKEKLSIRKIKNKKKQIN